MEIIVIDARAEKKKKRKLSSVILKTSRDSSEMGIDINLYRLRIGLFGQGRGYRAHQSHYMSGRVSRSSGAPDICYRLLAVYFVLRCLSLAGSLCYFGTIH